MSHSSEAIITWKIKVTTWKNYSTEHCGQTVTGMMTGFTEFGSLHNGNLKYGNFWVIVITWKIKINDLEKLLHPAL